MNELLQYKNTAAKTTPIGRSSGLRNCDNQIRSRIKQLTSENNAVWTSPNHNRTEFVHRFFQYPAMMVPVVQKRLIDIIKHLQPSIKTIIDPFMGSATSLVACMQNGLDCYGQDVNPLSILLAHTRTGPYYVDAIREKYYRLTEEIENDNSKGIVVNFNGRNKWFKESIAIELSKIVRAIRKEPRLAIRRFYWINLAEVVRLTSNDRTSTFKLHTRTQAEIESRNLSPINEFKAHLLQSLEDLERYRKLLLASGQLSKGAYRGQLVFKLLDSCQTIFTPNCTEDYFDLLVTSPPYGDNRTTVTYGQHSYLPLQWIDLHDIDSKVTADMLKSTHEIDTRSLGGRVSKQNQIQVDYLCDRSQVFSETVTNLRRKSDQRFNKVVWFLNDLNKVIENITKVMKPNSYQVWTIGNRTVAGIEIPNSEILREFVASSGGILVDKIEREIINKRMAKRNSSSALMNTEDILIFRKIV